MKTFVGDSRIARVLLIMLLAFSLEITASTLQDIGAVSEELTGQVVTIAGEIVESNVLRNGNIAMQLSDDSGTVQILIFPSLQASAGQFPKGAYLEVTGKVKEFAGKLEVQPRTLDDLKLFTKVSNLLSASDVGSYVEMSCEVLSTYSHPKGHLFLTVAISETGQELEVPIFNVSDSMAQSLSAGDTLLVRGKVSEYKGRLQVIPEGTHGVQLIVDRSGPSEPQLVSIGQITRSERGQYFQVRATIESLESRGGHTYLTLLDVSMQDRARAVLFRADAEEISGRKAKLAESYKIGAPVRLLISVGLYNDELQLIIDKVYNRFQ